MATYTYRADGLRNSKTVNGDTRSHVWLAGSIVLELDGSGAIINRFDRGIFGELIRSEQHGFYLFNKRGDVVQRVNAQGQILRNYRYTAFGVEKNCDASNDNPFRFMGEYWDSETGTYYLRARNFSSRLGRFTQEDPIRCGMNWYIFAFNNPIMFKDPTGLSPWIPLRSEVEAVGGSINWNINTNTAIATIGNLSGSFTAGTDGVQIRGTGNNGTMYVRADVFATEMFGNANQSVIFTSHNVARTNNQHISIIIFAGENSSLLTGNYSEHFINTRFGMQYATIGGGGTVGFGQRFNRALTALTGLPTAGLRLTGEFNHERDVNLTNKVFWYNLNIHNISTINSLFTKTRFYQDHYQGRVAYGVLPAANSRYFNSSSFAYGLLRASGITRPNLNNTGLIFPGWDKPLPNRAFTVVPQI